MRPLFLALCEHAFNATSLSSPVRSGTMATGGAPVPAPPRLAALVAREAAQAGIDEATVAKCAQDVQQKLTPREARDAVLAMYVSQALVDANSGNVHRAHVLLADSITELTAVQADDLSNTFATLKRFFQERPSEARLQDFADQLDSLMQLLEEQVILRGEHAAVLRAGGLNDAADVTRGTLLTELRLVTLPVIDFAIARAERHGWRAPERVTATRSRLDDHVATLADGFVTGDAFLKEATWPDVDKERAVLVAAAKTFSAVVAAGMPMQYDAEQQRFSTVGIKSLASDERIAAVAAWCAGQPANERLEDGAGYMILGLHWLAQQRPTLARAAFVAGADRLLEGTRAAEAEIEEADGEAAREAAAAVLVRRLNAYRLLTAAGLVSTDLPGAVAPPVDQALMEIEVLLLAWRQTWLKAGLSQKPVDGVVAECARFIEQRSRGNGVAYGSPKAGSRYFFFDYRFLGNGVPEVVVAKASGEELVDTPRLPELATTERFVQFVKSFGMPRSFSPGFSARWQK